MAEATIPTRGDVSDFFIDIDIGGITRRLKFIFNFRWSRWIFGVYDEEDNVIVDGIPLQVGVDLLTQFGAYNVPPGFYMAIDTQNGGDVYLMNDLGDRIVLGATDGQ